MESCSFIKFDGSRCSQKFNVKEVEFRHPDYKDLSQLIFLCQTHFFEVFGEQVAKKSSKLPLEVEKWLELQVKNEDSHYRKKLGDTKKAVSNGIGSDHFDWETFRATNRIKLEDLKTQLYNLRRRECRFEWCKAKITNFRKIYTIRVYPRNQIDYVNLIFCSLDHWEVFKKRIGLQTMKGKLNPDTKKASLTLDHYNGVVQ